MFKNFKNKIVTQSINSPWKLILEPIMLSAGITAFMYFAGELETKYLLIFFGVLCAILFPLLVLIRHSLTENSEDIK